MNHVEFKKKAFAKNPKLYEEYIDMKPEFEITRMLIQARIDMDMTQKDLAEKIGIQQSHISRLESGNHNPSLAFLKKIAKGLGKELHIEFVDAQNEQEPSTGKNIAPEKRFGTPKKKFSSTPRLNKEKHLIAAKSQKTV